MLGLGLPISLAGLIGEFDPGERGMGQATRLKTSETSLADLRGTMRTWLRRLRGVLGAGTIWGSMGVVFGSIFGALGSLFLGGGFYLGDVLEMGGAFGLFGLLWGGSFAGILMAADGRKSLEDLSPVRLAVWGGVAGVLFPLVIALAIDAPFHLIWGSLLPVVGVFGSVGVAMGAGTILIARAGSKELSAGAAPGSERELQQPGDAQSSGSGEVADQEKERADAGTATQDQV